MVAALQTAGKPAPGPAVRLTFTLLFSAAIHAAAILGITLTYLSGSFSTQISTRTLEITLARHSNETRPGQAGYLATTPGTEATNAEPDPAFVTTVSPAAQPDDTSPANQPEENAPITAGASIWKSLLVRSLEIPRLDQQQQTNASRPRIKRLTSLSTATRPEAFYLNSWRRKIENIGSLNYPKESRRQKIYGSLRLMVAILPDGSLHDIELLESSGHQILDDAAVRIVRLAAPFAPFPNKLRETTDVLEIIRTWRFRRNDSFESFPG